MASARRSIDSNEPSVSSHLLGTGSFISSYTCEVNRPFTPVEGIIRQEWYCTLLSTLLELWANICDTYGGPWRENLRGKLAAILRCFCLPCFVLTRTLNGRRRYFKPQTGVIYLYLYLGATVVINLVVALRIKNEISVAEYIQKYSVIISMFVALIFMLYLFVYTYETVTFDDSRGTVLRFFNEGGLFIFGLSSFGYSVCVVIDYVSCGHVLDAIVAVMKAMFILLQILFLHFFYEVRIPENSPYIQILLAHLLGTNLGLWFWTLCSDEAAELLNAESCTHYPIPLGSSEDYFSPLFVEYLLLAASLFYQIWNDLSPQFSGVPLPQRHCSTCSCSFMAETANSQFETENGNGNSVTDAAILTRSTSRARNSSSGLGLFVGGVFAVLFIVLVLMSKATGAHHQVYHIAYSVGIFILYFFQLCTRYICQLSSQSHQRNPERFSLNHEDILLYISLTGILLWEGFHSYSLILSGFSHGSDVFDMATDTLATVQHLFQTTTLVNIRRHKRIQGRCSVWICECVLFLMITNFTLWVQDSFFFDVDITTPGERHIQMQHDLTSIGYIIYPLSIFFRFHSSVCCIIAWSIFRNVS